MLTPPSSPPNHDDDDDVEKAPAGDSPASVARSADPRRHPVPRARYPASLSPRVAHPSAAAGHPGAMMSGGGGCIMPGYAMSPPHLHMAGVGDAAAALYQFHAGQAALAQLAQQALAQQQFQYESMMAVPGPMMPLHHPGAYGVPGMHTMAGMPYMMQGAMMGAAGWGGGHMPMAPPVLHPSPMDQRGGSPAPTGFQNGCGKRVAFERVESTTWLKDLQFSAGRAFDRLCLTDRSGPERRESVLAAILAGKEGDRRPLPTADGKTVRRPCYIVKRDHDRKTHFQVPVSGARVLAQKVVVACYSRIDIADMGTWQVQQDCCQGDGTWWCFEPSHLSKCAKDHLPKSGQRHGMPEEPHAIYRPLQRGGQPGKRKPRRVTDVGRAGKSSRAHFGSGCPSGHRSTPPYRTDVLATAGDSSPLSSDAVSDAQD